MIKSLIFLLSVLTSTFSFGQELSLQVADCNSLQLAYNGTINYGGSYVLEKKIDVDIWQKADNEDATSSESNFLSLSNGTYRAILFTPDITKVLSNEIIVDCEDFKDDLSSIKIWPNPASDHVSLRLERNENSRYSYVVYSIDGNKLVEAQLDSNVNRIPVHGFDSGIYFISIYQDNRLLESRPISVFQSKN